MTSKNQRLLLIFILGALLLLFPLLIRLVSGTAPWYGSETAHTLHIAGQGGTYDHIQDRELPFNLFFVLTGYLPVHEPWCMLLLPFVLGLGTLLFFIFLTKKQPLSSITLLFLVTSPLFVYVFSTFSPLVLVVFLTIAGTYVLFKTRGWLSFPFFALLPLIDLFAAVVVFALLIIYTIYQKKKVHDIYIIGVSMILVGTIMLVTNTITLAGYFFPLSAQRGLAEFGAFPGLTVPLLILAVLGLYRYWSTPKQRLLGTAIFCLFLLGSLSSPMILIFFGLLLPFFASHTIQFFLERNWAVGFLQQATLILIFFSLLFPLISFYAEVIEAPPSPELIADLSLLDQYTLPNDRVLSSVDNGFFIQTYAATASFLDPHSRFYPQYQEKQEAAETLWYSRNLETTTALLAEFNITYFYIDPDIQEHYWNNKEEGLLFLLKNSDRFVLLHGEEGRLIYQYTPRT